MAFISEKATEESIELGRTPWYKKIIFKSNTPKMCRKLPIPRRNITVTTVAPTGTVSLIAGSSSGIEPIFSEIIVRNDKTGTYTFENDLASQPYFRCAVSANGATEVTWEEHVAILASAQKYVDSGISKTINFPQGTHRETMGKAAFLAWESGCKGVAMYRNNSRKAQVLTPKNLKKQACPICGGEIVDLNGKKKCTSCTKELIEETSTYYD
jgi:ribonucleoside-diphosphate reductase alpha chain